MKKSISFILFFTVREISIEGYVKIYSASIGGWYYEIDAVQALALTIEKTLTPDVVAK